MKHQPEPAGAVEDLTAALLEVAAVARWPAGPLLLDVDDSVLRDLLSPRLAAALAGTCTETCGRPPAAALEQAPDAPTQPSAHGHGHPTSGCADSLTAALVAVTSSARWPSGPLLIDLHPTVTRDLLVPLLLVPLLLAALPGACPSAPPTAVPRPPTAVTGPGGLSATSTTLLEPPC